MTDHGPLFTLAPHSDEDTSRAAAKAIVPHVERLELLVLRALAHGPLTDAGIQSLTHLEGSTERPRRVALVGKGLVRETGEHEMLPSGRSAKTWQLTDKGREAAS